MKSKWRKHVLYDFLFSLTHTFQKHCTSHCTVLKASLRKLLFVSMALGCSPSRGVGMLFSDIWNCIRHWSFLNPLIFPLESYSFFFLFSVVPTEWSIVPYSRFSMATNQIQPGLETGMKFQGVRLKVTTGELCC